MADGTPAATVPIRPSAVAGRRSTGRRGGAVGPLGWGLVLAGLAWFSLSQSRAAVDLALRIPPAETWVLGDPIPLYWRFSNSSTQALGFMWEGCCRLNGRLDVSAVETSAHLLTYPAGQALAHMFAKADRLEPGIAKEYDTKVSDWIGLPGTGRYRLQGTYRGVLPTQYPQVQRGLSLWKDAATSPPIELAVLSVSDYLAQREERVRRGGVRVTWLGPDRLSPLEPARYTVRLENLGVSSRRLDWPEDVSLWVVSATGRRGAPMAVVAGAATNVVLPPGGALERGFVLSPDRFEGEPWEDYTAFVDLAEGAGGEPRVPSNPGKLTWRWGAVEVEGLVREAARGAGTGGRNAALKMLRVHLGQVGPILASVDRSRWDVAAQGLADRLELASRLRVLSPRPGEVAIAVSVNGRGEAAWAGPVIGGVLGRSGGGLTDQVRELTGVRRHLGWDLTPVLVPADDAALAVLLSVAERLFPDPADWTGPPEIRVSIGTNAAPARVVLRAASAPGGVTVGAAGPEDSLEKRLGAGTAEPVMLPGETAWGSVRRAVERAGRPGERREMAVWVRTPE